LFKACGTKFIQGVSGSMRTGNDASHFDTMKQMKNEKKISMRTLNDLSHFDRMKKKQEIFVTITSFTCIHAFVNNKEVLTK